MKKIVLAGMVLVLTLICGWVLGTGFAFVEPNTVKIIYHPKDYIDKEITYKLVPHINTGSGKDLIWKWPMFPTNIQIKKWPDVQRAKMGQTKEVINLEQLKFQVKIALWPLDDETGKPADKDTIVSLVVSGELQVQDWQKFAEVYDPDFISYDIEEIRKIMASGGFDFGTLDTWSVRSIRRSFAPAAVEILDRTYGEFPSRVDYVKKLMAQEGFKSYSEVEKFIKEKHPYIWVVGPANYYGAQENPFFLYMAAMQGDQMAYYLSGVLDYQEFVGKTFQAVLVKLESNKNSFLMIVKPDLLEEGEKLLAEFEQYMKKRFLDISLYSSADLEPEIERFFQQSPFHTKGGQQVFVHLVRFEWQKSQLMSMLEQAKSDFEKEIIPFFQKNIKKDSGGSNDFLWELAVSSAMAEPQADPESLTEKAVYIMGRSQSFLRELEALPKYIKFFEVWEIKGMSFQVQEFPLFSDGKKIDKDFYVLYETLLKEQREEK